MLSFLTYVVLYIILPNVVNDADIVVSMFEGVH